MKVAAEWLTSRDARALGDRVLPPCLCTLQPPASMRSARFDVVFLDDTMRITRGDRVSAVEGRQAQMDADCLPASLNCWLVVCGRQASFIPCTHAFISFNPLPLWCAGRGACVPEGRDLRRRMVPHLQRWKRTSRIVDLIEHLLRMNTYDRVTAAFCCRQCKYGQNVEWEMRRQGGVVNLK